MLSKVLKPLITLDWVECKLVTLGNYNLLLEKNKMLVLLQQSAKTTKLMMLLDDYIVWM